jgi:hypothetical protein
LTRDIGVGRTTTATESLLFSAAAVTQAVPAATPLTTPAEDTVAIAAFEVLHAIALETSAPARSVVVAESAVVSPLNKEGYRRLI